jgi:hypothetical protein
LLWEGGQQLVQGDWEVPHADSGRVEYRISYGGPGAACRAPHEWNSPHDYGQPMTVISRVPPPAAGTLNVSEEILECTE